MKELIIQKLKTGKILIYGNDEKTLGFVIQLKELFADIIHVTDFVEDIKLQPFAEHDIKTVSFDDYDKNEERYIVITGQFGRAKTHLELMKFKEYADFASVYLIRTIMQSKRLVITVGNGAMSQITAALKACPDFSQKYYVRYYNNKNFNRGEIRQYQEYQHLAKASDVYLYTIKTNKAYKRNVLIDRDRMLFENKAYIGISGNEFNGFHPNLKREYAASSYCYREYDMKEIPYVYYAFAPYDRMMNCYIESDLLETEISESIKYEQMFSAAEIERNFENAIINIRMSDEIADIKLADVIDKLKTQVIVNRSNEEWHPKIIEYILNSIFERIGHNETRFNYSKIELAADEYSGNEVIVLPAVFEYFGLKDLKDGKKFRIFTPNDIKYMTFDEYADYYAAYCVRARKMSDVMNFKSEQDAWNLIDYINAAVCIYGSKIAIRDDYDFVRFNGIRTYSRAIASFMCNTGKKQLIAVMLERPVRAMIASIGAMFSGNEYCCIPNELPENTKRKILREINPTIIITDSDLVDKTEELYGITAVDYREIITTEEDVCALDNIKKSLKDNDVICRLIEVKDNHAVKFRTVYYNELMEDITDLGASVGISKLNNIGCCTSIYEYDTLIDILMGLKYGCSVRLIKDSLLQNPKSFIEHIDVQNITMLHCNDKVAECILALPESSRKYLQYLKKIFYSSDRIEAGKIEQLKAALPKIYFIDIKERGGGFEADKQY